MNPWQLNPFQFVLLLLIAGLLAGGILALLKGWLRRRDAILWLLFWTVGAVAVVWPDATSLIAAFLGIGRGADLVFYCAIPILSFGIWMLYIRLRRVRREITLLVRHVAMLEGELAARGDPASGPAASPPADQSTR
ncbi:MAG: DUF2304 domain-containing protein [Phycisphaerae bacterium]|nr:DUF2304 domain-containing protein [Phycisphaerae bacterium]